MPPATSIAQPRAGASPGQPRPPCHGLRVLGAFVLLLLAVAAWPVDVLHIHDASGARLLSQPAVPGLAVWTGYVHSLQRTPVWDSYRVAAGRLWMWREYVQSHNAGLPHTAPERGRFALCPPWMLVESARPLPDLRLRVGDARLGRNHLALCAEGRERVIPLYAHQPRRLLRFSVQRQGWGLWRRAHALGGSAPD